MRTAGTHGMADADRNTALGRDSLQALELICHRLGYPYDVTLTFLEEALPELEREGFELVAVSSLTELRTERAEPNLRARRMTEQTD